MTKKTIFFSALLFLCPARIFSQALSLSSYTGLNTVAAQSGINLSQSPITIHQILFRPVGTVTTCTVALDSSADGVTWTAGGAIAGQTCTASGAFTSGTVHTNFVRVNVTAFTGTGSVNVIYQGQGVLGVAGTAAAGTTPVGNPVLVGASDGANVQTARTCSVFKTATATASGNTPLWTPAAGKKFRLMRYEIIVPGSATFATTAGTVVMTFQDAAVATGITTKTVQVPTAAVTGVDYASAWVDLGNGFLSSTANNVLNINLVLNGTGAFAGGVVVNACGTEE